ncbi:hypothetical protein [Ancylobacter moscoviensis]
MTFTTIAASPGFAVLAWSGKPLGMVLTMRPILAWRIPDDGGRPIAVTPEGDHGLEDYAILYPDGRVQGDDEVYPDIATWRQAA